MLGRNAGGIEVVFLEPFGTGASAGEIEAGKGYVVIDQRDRGWTEAAMVKSEAVSVRQQLSDTGDDGQRGGTLESAAPCAQSRGQ